ncbi:glycosyltransferase family 4 protein [Bdellovibrio sp. HCB-162]|uniref:glycosyltransferase family 4 protein n=1 Tax=Bdellovibrio sp. HCB-162 TaxID=3394234 RepID=UPI0039BCBB27
MNKKEILFLSPFDFVEKGIQVVAKTPQYFAKNGWRVNFVVIRDYSKLGSYYYQTPFNPDGLNVLRYKMFSVGSLEKLIPRKLFSLYSKLRGYVTVLQLVRVAIPLLINNKEINILYGYGPLGSLSVAILKMLFYKRRLKIISRFFGITDSEELIKSRWKRILNWDVVAAMSLNVDLCIITNDGTQGDQVMQFLSPKSVENLKFWINGVDPMRLPSEGEIQEQRRRYGIEPNDKVILAVSRLVSWKRVDRSLKIVAILVNEYNLERLKFVIVGDGSEKAALEKLTSGLGIEKNVIFTGAVANKEISTFLSLSNIFISTYDLSNVGNPLLEAIRANKVIFTLNNGDTGKWINHKVNGFIYDIDDCVDYLKQMADDIHLVLESVELREQILKNLRETEHNKLWTWDDRLNEELFWIEKLLES